jgi:hypothetical protein
MKNKKLSQIVVLFLNFLTSMALLMSLPQTAGAEEANPEDTKYRSIGISTLQWSESLKITQSGTSENEVANYSGISLNLRKDLSYPLWGWFYEGFIGLGQANSGGNTSLNYQKDKLNFSIFGAHSGLFYQLSQQIRMGLSLLAYQRNIDWKAETPGVSVESINAFNLMPLIDLSLNISKDFDFYQEIGPLNSEGTFWKLGLAYKF